MKVEYKNRYSDIITFDETDENEVLMGGGRFMRYGYDEDPSIINMIDPSGGPYITIGTNLKMFFEDGVDRIIESISFIEDKSKTAIDDPICVLFKIKTKQ